MAARGLRAAALAAALAAAVPAAGQEAPPPPPFAVVVNGAAVVENSAPARALRQTESEVRDRVQAENDRVQADLEARERELVRLRDELPADQFEARTAEFDRRVRAERRAAQERGALLLKFLQDARGALVSALPRVLEIVRRETGAALVIDSGAVLALDPGLDVTALAIQRYDEEMGGVRFDPPAALLEPAEAPRP